jgi:metal-responsive CopG/Arc/MetJ family transcriptional regulator
MKTAISLPDDLFMDAERLSRRKRISRSELYANAIRWYVQKESGAGITDQLNKIYAKENLVDDIVEKTGVIDLGKEDWS